jgi:hypothetical protein
MSILVSSQSGSGPKRPDPDPQHVLMEILNQWFWSRIVLVRLQRRKGKIRKF